MTPEYEIIGNYYKVWDVAPGTMSLAGGAYTLVPRPTAASLRAELASLTAPTQAVKPAIAPTETTFPTAEHSAAIKLAQSDARLCRVSWKTSYHEAGHCVVQAALGGRVLGAWATAKRGGGTAYADEPFPATSAAGAVAAQRAGYRNSESPSDLEHIQGSLTLARVDARRIVGKHWMAVETMARRLNTHGWMDEATIAATLKGFGLIAGKRAA